MKKLAISVLSIAFAWVCSAEQRPNVVVLLVDDMGYSDLSCMGAEINTPNLDKLAGNGVLFTQAYNTAKCYPSRVSLLTGSYFQASDREFNNTTTVAEMVGPTGYKTYWVGKHHSRFDPRTRGFDHFYGFLGGANNYWNPGNAQAPGGKMPAISGVHKWYFDGPEPIQPFIPDRTDWFMTDVFTDQGIEWLKASEEDGKPFFLYIAYNAPHWPLQAPQEYIDRCRSRYDAGYEAIRNARYKRQIESGLFNPEIVKLTEPDYDQAWDSFTPERRARRIEQMEVYAAVMENLDHNVGRLVEQLKASGQLDNTLILFLSDNGASKETPAARVKNYSDQVPVGGVDSFESYGQGWAAVGNTPFHMFKGSSYEGGICTPMIAHWPKGIQSPGRVSYEPVHLIDLMPTMADLSGATLPDGLEGLSLLGQLQNRSVTREHPLYWEFNYGRAVRRGDMKLVAKGNSKWQLFNIANDRSETKDLSAQMPEVTSELNELWEDWWQESTSYPFSEKRARTQQSKKPKNKKR